MTSPTANAVDAREITRLQGRVRELTRESDHLVAVVDILQEISTSLHFVDILQAIARKLGQAFGLDRCSIFLSGEQKGVRLVASYEYLTIRNLVVDLNRYPELKRAFDSGETVFIPDAPSDPVCASDPVDARRAKRPLDRRGADPLAASDGNRCDFSCGPTATHCPSPTPTSAFAQIVAALTAKALRNAHRFEALLRTTEGRRLPSSACVGPGTRSR